MKTEQLFEAFDRSFDYRIKSNGIAKFKFTDEGEEFYTEVDYTPIRLSNAIGTKNHVMSKFNNPRELMNYFNTKNIKVMKTSFQTYSVFEQLPVEESNNFEVQTVTAIMATIIKIIEDAMNQDSDIRGIYYQPTSISRTRLYERLFRRYQKKASERYELLEPERNLFFLLEEDVIDDIIEVGQPEGIEKGKMADPSDILRDILGIEV